MDLHSDYPFWMIKEGIIQSFPKLHENLETEVLIIGGGITGAIVAHRLAESGHEVTVVEKRHIAHGSTSASTALLQYEIDLPLFRLSQIVGEPNAAKAYQLCAEAIDHLGQLAAKFSGKAGFKKIPSLYFASFEEHVKSIIEPEFKARKKHGFEVESLNKKDIKKRFGFSAPAGILSQQGGQINPYKMCHYLLNEIIKKGNKVFDSTEIADWEKRDEAMWLRTVEGHEITAKHVVVACGYESEKYLEKKVTDMNCTFAIVSLPMDQNRFWEDNALIWETKIPYLYVRTTEDNRIMVGGHDEPFSSAKKRDSLLPQKRLKLEQDFHALFPEIPFETDFAWAGTFGETEDGLPYIGSHDNPRMHYAMGYGGNGITFSVIAADLITAEIEGEKHPNAAIFGFDR